MPLSFIRVVCGRCDVVISNGWPADDAVQPETPRKISRQVCRNCEVEDVLQAAEDRRRGLVNA